MLLHRKIQTSWFVWTSGAGLKEFRNTRIEEGRLYTAYSLREHPVFTALFCWFHIRIQNRQSLKYYRFSKTSWKIHENIALSFNNKSQGFLSMLVESFNPKTSYSFLKASHTIFSHAFARDPRKNSRVTSSNMQGELWLVTNSWRHEIFFSARFRRQIFSAAETKVEKTECSRRLVVCRIRNTHRRVPVNLQCDFWRHHLLSLVCVWSVAC